MSSRNLGLILAGIVHHTSLTDDDQDFHQEGVLQYSLAQGLALHLHVEVNPVL